jgi:hypothetical protein
MASAALEKLRAQRAAAAAAANGNATAPAAAEQPKPELVAGAINPPGEACDPPAALLEKEAPAAEQEAPSAAEAPTTALKKPRGRPAGSKNAPKAEAPASVPNAPVAAETKSPSDDTAPKSTSGDKKIHTLYINCRPVKGESPTAQLADANSLIAQAHTAICDEFKIDHYSFLDYGKSRGAMAHAVATLVDSGAGLMDVVINTTTQEARDCLQVLIQRAECVVVGGVP